MELEDNLQIDIKRLREDLIDYFSTAINPIVADLIGIEEIDNFQIIN